MKTNFILWIDRSFFPLVMANSQLHFSELKEELCRQMVLTSLLRFCEVWNVKNSELMDVDMLLIDVKVCRSIYPLIIFRERSFAVVGFWLNLSIFSKEANPSLDQISPSKHLQTHAWRRSLLWAYIIFHVTRSNTNIRFGDASVAIRIFEHTQQRASISRTTNALCQHKHGRFCFF